MGQVSRILQTRLKINGGLPAILNALNPHFLIVYHSETLHFDAQGTEILRIKIFEKIP